MSHRFKSPIIVVMRVLAIALCFLLLLHDGPPRRRSLEALNHTMVRPFNAANVDEEEEAEEGESEEFEDIDGRGDWFTYQRTYPFNGIPANARQRAWETVNRLRSQSLLAEAAVRNWQPLGPSPTIPIYFNNWGLTSGRINTIAVSPADSRIVLIGSATGGIWRSSDSGASFVPVSDNQVDLAVGSIAFAKSQPTTVYAGMGDSKVGYLGSGVLKSTDAGLTWSRINNDSLPTPGTISKLVVDPANANRVYVAQFSHLATDKVVSSGLYLSNDGGVNWKNVLVGAARDITIHPSNSNILFGGIARLNEDNPPPMRAVRSTDAGATWTTILTGGEYDIKRRQDCRVAISPVDPQKVYAYYGGMLGTIVSSSLQSSTDGGDTWRLLGTDGFDTGQIGYNSYLVADPSDSNTVYFGSRDAYRSTDSGVTWQNLTQGFTFNGSFFDYSPGISKAHPDQHALVFVPGSSTAFYIGCDGGIYQTLDNGATFQSLNRTLTLTQFTSLAIQPSDVTVSLGGTQDNGVQRRQAQDIRWREVFTGDGGHLVYDPINPDIVFTTYINGNVYRYTGGGQFFDTQIANNDTFGEHTDPVRIAFYPPFAGNGADATIYFGTWRLFISNDLGQSWFPPAGDLDLTKGITDKGNDVLSAIGVSRSNTSVIYTGSAQGRAMASSDGGATWRDITSGLPNRSITSIKVDTTNPGVAYLTVSGFNAGHAFKTTDGGTTWQNISGNLPDIPASTLLIDPLDTGMIYIGTDIGVFRSTGGTDWQPLMKGMPPVVVTELAAHPSGVIQAATYGRGAFELPPAPAPMIVSVTWNGAKLLTISGSLFDTGAHLVINDVDRTTFIRSITDTTIRLKSKAKKLGLSPGDNTIRVIDSDGTPSNVFVLKI